MNHTIWQNLEIFWTIGMIPGFFIAIKEMKNYKGNPRYKQSLYTAMIFATLSSWLGVVLFIGEKLLGGDDG